MHGLAILSVHASTLSGVPLGLIISRNGGSLQVTKMLNDADVVDDSGAPVSEHGACVSEVRYPGDDGQPSGDASLSFRYTFDGLVATRADARGMVFAHEYDELSRRTETLVDDGAWFAQPAAGVPDWRALNGINEIDYAYLPDGKLDLVTAYTASPSQSGQTLAAQNHFEYDEFDNLKRERQAHAEALELDTPDVEYTWTFNRIGHQGLFYDRLDGTMDDPSLEPNAVGLYYNRNRSYAPHLGRFMQKDPSATALGVITDLAMLGDDLAVAVIPLRSRGQYADGLSLYQYARAMPIGARDPSGLFSLIELSGASALSMDLESNNADLALAALGGIKGLVGFVNYRNLIIADALGSEMYETDAEGIDAALGIYESYQKVQSAMLVGGLIKAGIGLAAVGFAAYAYDAYHLYRRSRFVRPAWKRLTVDWGHIISGHTEGGTRYRQALEDFEKGAARHQKTPWSSHWSQRDIEKAVRQAYETGNKVEQQGDRFRLVGVGGGVLVEMWVNAKALVIESAYPKGRR